MDTIQEESVDDLNDQISFAEVLSLFSASMGRAVCAVCTYRTRYIFAIMVATACCLVVPLALDVDTFYFPLLGGSVGFIGASHVLIQFLLYPKYAAQPMALLFWRSLADLGLATRFILTPAFNVQICGDYECRVDPADRSNEEKCALASFMVQFFEICSEAWFLCIAIDLYLTMTDPFSTFKNRMKYYHIFSWGLGLTFAIPTLVLNKTVSGFWTVQSGDTEDQLVSDNVFCWVRMPHNSWTGNAFIFFYLPLVLSFCFSSVVVYNSFKRLRRGLTHTFIHRLRVLFINTINLMSCLAYWGVLLTVYVGIFIASDDGEKHSSRTMLKIFMYLISSKGLVAVLEWVLVTGLLDDLKDMKIKKGEEAVVGLWNDDGKSLDVNVALRKEVLLYASEGIRKTTKRAREISDIDASESAARIKSQENQFPPGTSSKTRFSGPLLRLSGVTRFSAGGSKDIFRRVPDIRIYMKHEVETEEDTYASRQHDHLTFSNFVLLTLGFKNRIRNYLEALYERGAKAEEKVDSMRESLGGRLMIARGFDSPPSRTPSLGPIMSSDSVSDDALRVQAEMEMGEGDTEGRLSDRQTLETNPTSSKRRPSKINTDMESWEVDPSSLDKPAIRTISTDSDSGYGFGEEDKTTMSAESDRGGKPSFTPSVGSGSYDEQHLSWHSKNDVRESIVETDEIFDFRDVEEKEFTLGEWIIAKFRDVGMWLKDKLWEQEVDERVEFTEHMPFFFRKVRLSSDFDDDFYRDLFSTTAKQRLTQGGKSGALFFYSKDEFCIAKSVTEEEKNTLLSYAEKYCQYMVRRKDSYICKIFGVYTLQIYGNKLHFFVMNNIFLNKRGHTSLEKFDIKGSWVARNATYPRNGSLQKCRHCEQMFVYRKKHTFSRQKERHRVRERQSSVVTSPIHRTSLNILSGSYGDVELGSPPILHHSKSDDSSEECSVSSDTTSVKSGVWDQGCPLTVDGNHEPDVVYKDNDLREKMLLGKATSEKTLRTLNEDAAFLHSLGVMDYSLLVGVHRTVYDVKDPDDREEGGDTGSRNYSAQPAGNSLSDTDDTHATISSSMTIDISRVNRRPPREDSPKKPATSSPLSFTSDPRGDLVMVDFNMKHDSEMHYSLPLEVGKVRGPDCYYMAIVDFQQKWTIMKKLERYFKVAVQGVDKDGLSAINPDAYFRRFCAKLEDLFDLTNTEYEYGYQERWKGKALLEMEDTEVRDEVPDRSSSEGSDSDSAKSARDDGRVCSISSTGNNSKSAESGPRSTVSPPGEHNADVRGGPAPSPSKENTKASRRKTVGSRSSVVFRPTPVKGERSIS